MKKLVIGWKSILSHKNHILCGRKHKHFGFEKGVNIMTLRQIEKDIANCGMSQYFDKDGNLITIFELFGGTFEIIVSNGGTSLRTSNVIARHENCDIQDMLNILGIS